MIRVMASIKTSLANASLGAVALLGAQSVFANCWQDAAVTYNIPVTVLAAVAKHESGFNPNAIHVNDNKSRDLGLMQINESHLPDLARFGIQEKDLFDACTNLKVGAWILSTNATRLGWNWDAIGAYNVGCKKLDKAECERRRASYAWKILASMKRLGEKPTPNTKHKSAPMMVAAAPVAVAVPAPTLAVGNPGIVDYKEVSVVTARYVSAAPVRNESARPIRTVVVNDKAMQDDDAVEQPFNDWYNNPEAIVYESSRE